MYSIAEKLFWPAEPCTWPEVAWFPQENQLFGEIYIAWWQRWFGQDQDPSWKNNKYLVHKRTLKYRLVSIHVVPGLAEEAVDG